MYIRKNILTCIVFCIFASACSMPNMNSLWPSGEPDDSVIITELPNESYEPEDVDIINIEEDMGQQQSMEEIIITDSNEEYIDSSQDSIEDLITKSSTMEEDSQIISNSNDQTTARQAQSVITYVGKRALEMRNEYSKLVNIFQTRKSSFIQLQENGTSSAETYHATVAAIGARLQVGTTPGNPILLAQYEQAQIELAEVGGQGQSLVDLGNKIALLSARTSYLLEATRSAKRLRGAIDEDHRNLSKLEDDLKISSVNISRLLEELNEAVRRRDIYLASERRRLTQLAASISVGESFGTGLGNVPALPPGGDLQKSSNSNLSGNPIAIIRIEGESEEYKQGLYGAVSAALDTQPNATFTLVAVSSTAGNASEKAEKAANAREKAGKIMSSLISMGMPSGRLSVTEVAVAEVESQEIRLYAD